MHARTQIRNAVTTLLLNNTSAGNKVYESRVYALLKIFTRLNAKQGGQ